MRNNKTARQKIKTKLPLERTEKSEFPKGLKGVTFCNNCGVAYYKKSWHHSLHGYKSLSQDVEINFSLCPACKMIKNNQFEGEVSVKNIPEDEVQGVIKLVEGYGRRAYDDDPLDRVISIKRMPRGTGKEDVIITTTENQLAKKMAKKIKDAFNKVKITYSFSKAPSDVVYVDVEFLT